MKTEKNPKNLARKKGFISYNITIKNPTEIYNRFQIIRDSNLQAKLKQFHLLIHYTPIHGSESKNGLVSKAVPFVFEVQKSTTEGKESAIFLEAKSRRPVSIVGKPYQISKVELTDGTQCIDFEFDVSGDAKMPVSHSFFQLGNHRSQANTLPAEECLVFKPIIPLEPAIKRMRLE